jgi:hypothetical protein
MRRRLSEVVKWLGRWLGLSLCVLLLVGFVLAVAGVGGVMLLAGVVIAVWRLLSLTRVSDG